MYVCMYVCVNKTGRQTNRVAVVVGSINIVFSFLFFEFAQVSFGFLFQIV